MVATGGPHPNAVYGFTSLTLRDQPGCDSRGRRP
jgi:hypothetical protein